jgi:acyl-[acyl-carrier-protein]-phospholipid O-acyltransferase/long-chain-fatty-acid--[acyl-carrier-protein] ligase
MSISADDSGILTAPLGMASPAPLAAEPAEGGIVSIRFLALVATQFFVALNDNMFRWLVVPIGSELLNSREMAVSLGSACFILPFLVCAAPAGYLADRFSKRTVMVVCKIAEIAIIAGGMAAILLGNVYLMFVVLFLLGGQAAIFITSKLGAIPELVRRDKIASANGIINMASMAAIIIGSLAGGILYDRTGPVGTNDWGISASALLGVAVLGWIASLWIGHLPSANPQRPFPRNPAEQTVRDMRSLYAQRPLFLAALGSSYFWALGMLSQVNIYLFANEVLFVPQQRDVGILLGVLTIGIGGGAVLAGTLSRGKIELGLVPFGAAGLAITSILLAFVPGGTEADPSVAGYYWSCFWLLAMGLTAGLYDLPLQAFLQDRSPSQSRGSIMAAYNFMAFGAMLAASGVFWLLSCPRVLGLSARTIFLIGGLVTLPATFLIIRLLPFHTTRLAVQMLVSSFYRVHVEGLENVPAGRGALVVANHISWADGVLLGLACPRHPRMVAFAPYFDNRWLGWFGRLGRIIPIGTTRKSMVQSIRLARTALQEGEIVCIFPEGGISRSGELQDFRPGFLSILKDTDAPVIPAYLGGLWGSIFSYQGGRPFRRWPKHWRYPVSIRFGRPIDEPESVLQVRQAVEELQTAHCQRESRS